MIDKNMKYNNLSSELHRIYVDMQQIHEQSLDADVKLTKCSINLI